MQTLTGMNGKNLVVLVKMLFNKCKGTYRLYKANDSQASFLLLHEEHHSKYLKRPGIVQSNMLTRTEAYQKCTQFYLKVK